MVNENISKKWYQNPIGFSVLTIAGLLFLPFTIGGALAYTAYKYTKNPKLRPILAAAILIPTLFIGSVWTEEIRGAFTSPPPEETIQQTASETPVLSEEEKKDPEEVAGQIAGKQAEKNTFLVTKVIDGDTIMIEGNQAVRYIGIDTPETVHPSKPVQCFGQEASAKNKELVEGKTVRLEKDVSETDKYGRLLRYVWIGDIFVNEYLVRQGYAQVSTYPPDVKYQDLFLEAQKEAGENSRGLWGACVEEPTPTPTPSPTPPPPEPPETDLYDCSGNIYNCSDFSTQAEAQAVFEYCGGTANDVHRLDADKDGVACESLSSAPPEPEPETQTPPSEGTYTCNCSKTCSQMSSCDEAYYQLNVCGCSKRDGDKDGVPCESICQ